MVSSKFTGLGRPHISHSQLSKLEDCSLNWYFRYVKGIKKPQSIQMLAGTCFHHAMATNFDQKIETGINLPEESVLAAFSDMFDTAVTADAVELKVGQSPSKFKNQGLLAVSAYYKDYGCAITPGLVEHEMVAQIPGTDYNFVGILDLRKSDGTVVDFKLTGKKWSEDQALNKQVTAYAFLLGQSDINFEFHVVLRADKPKVQVIPVKQTHLEINEFLDYVDSSLELMEDIRSGAVSPEPRGAYCNEHMCSYYQECQAWKYSMFE